MAGEIAPKLPGAYNGMLSTTPNGGWTKLNTTIMNSSAASLIYAPPLISSQFSTYYVVFWGLSADPGGTATIGLRANVSTDGGTTWQSSNYTYVVGYFSGTTATVSSAASGATSIALCTNLISDVAGEYTSGLIRIEGVTGALNNPASLRCNLSSDMYITTHTTPFAARSFGGGQSSATGVNAVKFFMTTGNIWTGTFVLYGVT